MVMKLERIICVNHLSYVCYCSYSIPQTPYYFSNDGSGLGPVKAGLNLGVNNMRCDPGRELVTTQYYFIFVWIIVAGYKLCILNNK